MKRFTLFSTLAVAALCASAQYTAEVPYLQPVADNANNKVFDVLVLNADCVSRLQKAGKTVNNIGPDDVTRHLYVWDNTFSAGDGSYPGVGWNADEMNFDGYTSLNVGTSGWSGAGFAMGDPGIDLSHITGDTRFHIALRTSSTAPASIAFILLDGDGINTPAKIAVGDPFNDNGAVFPAVAPKISDEWVAVDIKFSDIKKLYPTFDYEKNAVKGWKGNVLSFLGGGVTGNNISMDAVYFYTPASGGSAVETIEGDAREIVFSGNSVSVLGGQGIQIYDLSGKMVKSSASEIVGTEDLASGVYIVRSGAKAAKIAVK